MRLLALISFITHSLYSSTLSANDHCALDDTTTGGILGCVTTSYERIDKKLNKQYLSLLSSPDFHNRKLLIKGQRSWIKYRDLQCDAIFNAINPGEEAEIEKVGCFASLTSSRLSELIYIETGISNDNFYTMLSMIGQDLSKTRSELLQHINDIAYRFEGFEYAKQNCELVNSIHREDLTLCEARIIYKDLSLIK
jgi:uncharacterized protein YecT (DUF1311 family)